jgi:hypothetical protein
MYRESARLWFKNGALISKVLGSKTGVGLKRPWLKKGVWFSSCLRQTGGGTKEVIERLTTIGKAPIASKCDQQQSAQYSFGASPDPRIVLNIYGT